MDSPFKQLASLLDTRISGHTSQAVAGLQAEMGTMTTSGLKLDSYKYEIQDYMTADWRIELELPAFSLTGTINGGSSAKIDFETARIPDVKIHFKEGLQPGDRVLVQPVNNGSDFVVLCKVVV
ncbi:DUF2577 family protein [Paenibacillus tyrfis]|uniref:DUF2577 family protein n=1 Tax=Paenibacillus tyrfis TaxID=1501230 RepID=UPI0020A172DD|nr:DUF2577 family protein [Paenibacillus tyrfis]MCP1307798.1 DUF2577 domain-containing protein [Paenibacillus tyrfis]